MKSKHAVRKVKPGNKSLSRKAGEVIGTIAHGVAEGKSKVVEVAKSAAEKIKHIREAVANKSGSAENKKTAKKKASVGKKKFAKTAKNLTKKPTVKSPIKKAIAKKD
jgi:rare lipoprotein A (peptidoglycan hydrolase)